MAVLGPLIFISVLVIIAWLAAEYTWIFILVILIISLGIYGIWRSGKIKEKDDLKKKIHAEREIKLKKLDQIKENYKSKQPFLEDSLYVARRNLSIAEKEFEDRAFAPFWDAIEEVAKALSVYYKTLQGIGHLENEFRELRRDVGKVSTKLPMISIPNPKDIVSNMEIIVRKAQRDFEFSTIYEQRKTNKLLQFGFQTLSEAIVQVGDRIESALENLSADICDFSYDTNTHYSNVQEMLDNIQHRRKPEES